MSVTLARHSNLRSFTYTVYISEVDGRVLRITAGCHIWRSFDIAFKHYHGEGPYAPAKWTDNYIATLHPHQLSFELRAYRWEARAILKHLQEDARVRGGRILAQRARERAGRDD